MEAPSSFGNATASRGIESDEVMQRRDPLAVITAGGRWRDARGIVYVVTWVKKIGVLGYRRERPGGPRDQDPRDQDSRDQDPREDDREIVSDVVRFVLGFAPARGQAQPANL